MYLNCWRNARCSVYKVEIISFAFKWLIVLRFAIKTRDQTHRVLKNAFAASITRTKRTFTRLRTGCYLCDTWCETWYILLSWILCHSIRICRVYLYCVLGYGASTHSVFGTLSCRSGCDMRNKRTRAHIYTWTHTKSSCKLGSHIHMNIDQIFMYM